MLKRVLSLEFNRLLDYYKDARDIDVPDTKEGRRGKKDKERPHRDRAFADNGDRPVSDADKDRRTADAGMARIYVNAGKAQGFYAGNLITMINRGTRDKRIDVGRIDLLADYTLFDVADKDAAIVVKALRGADFFGQVLYSEVAEADKDYADASKRKTARKNATTAPRATTSPVPKDANSSQKTDIPKTTASRPKGAKTKKTAKAVSRRSTSVSDGHTSSYMIRNNS